MKFLEQIADYYTSGDRLENLSDYTFIFPNKRSAMFLKHYIKQRVKGDFVLLPRFTTFSNFAAFTSGMFEPNRFELLFILFNAYVEAIKEKDPKAEKPSFDKFIFWGDMILNDFDVIDSSLADAEKVYHNLRTLKEIQSDYLNDRQKEVIRHLWGETKLTQEYDQFWLHIQKFSESLEGNEKDEMVRKFISLWEVLDKVYANFKRELERAGLATAGMQFRRTAEILEKQTGIDDLRRNNRKYVFVGLADVSAAEIAIMKRLKDAGCAEFFWDLASPFFYYKSRQDGKDDDRRDSLDKSNLAIEFIGKMQEKFPSPIELEDIGYPQQIDIYGVPSSVVQTKMAGEIIKDMDLDTKQAFETAIVLPNTSQLMSLLLGLPEQNKEADLNKRYGVNITMGLPYSTTVFSTLFSTIISMQRRSRLRSDGQRIYFFQDVVEVLLNPHIQKIAGREATLIRHYILDKNLYNIEAPFLIKHFPSLEFIFRPINDKKGDGYLDDIEGSTHYVVNLLDNLRERMAKLPHFENSLEMEILDFLENKILDIKELIVRYKIKMTDTTFLALFERIMRSAIINLEGTPLMGLQVIGVLETRCLDFDNIIFMSMNEQSLPKRDYVRTMIPNNLRYGYNLPSIEHTESFYSYYFFRAISRARHVTLLYDTRAPGRGRGEMSRFIEQILKLHNNGNITHKLVEVKGKFPSSREIAIEKNDDVMKLLDKYKQLGSGKRISASALKTYMNCPLEFYLKHVAGMSGDNEPTDYLDAAQMGDIFHCSAQAIYDRRLGHDITAEVYDSITDEEIESTLLRETARQLGLDPEKATMEDITIEGRLVIINLMDELKAMFEAEKAEYCQYGGSFRYLAGELNVSDMQWTVGAHTFNLSMKIDRIDRLNDGTLRFIDYKTGRDETNISSIAQLFDGNYKYNGVFQLLMYANAFEDLVKKAVESGEKHHWLEQTGASFRDITYNLYTLRKLMSEGKIGELTISKKPMPPFSQLRDEFNALLAETIDAIFNSSTPFTQCEDSHRCKFCHFKTICGRTVPINKFAD